MPIDRAKRLRDLADRVEPRFRRRYLDLISRLGETTSLPQVTRLIELGRLEDALPLLELENAAASMSSLWGEVVYLSGQQTADIISRGLEVIVDFDQTNLRAVEAMRQNRLTWVREWTAEQRQVARRVMLRGTEWGLNPREQARMFRLSVGLTLRQEEAVNNYRRLLERSSPEALSRQLRDRRFDRSLRTAVRERQPLGRAQIDRMVGRYRERYVKYRAEVIARTEALRAVHEGAQEMYRQAIDRGVIGAGTLTQTWDTSKDERVRGSHRSMDGQTVRIGEPFISGLGNRLRYPCDPSAPPADTVQCRCALLTRFARSPVARSPSAFAGAAF
jgi:hypothetical protein